MENSAQGCAFRVAALCACLLTFSAAARADSLVRVKIFPHNSAFPAPQGAESEFDHFTLTAEKGTCTEYAAATGSAADGLTTDHPIATGTSFRFDASTLAGPAWLTCTTFAALEREGAKENLLYRGNFFVKKITPVEGKPYLTLVNVLPFEDYLRAVVPAEMESSWPLEALKAQAVAARTYALFEIAGDDTNVDPKLTEEKSGAELDDTVFFQAYEGEARETPQTDQAVHDTNGLALFSGGRLIKAYFHGDSGGHTEDALYGFGNALPYCLGKQEIYAPNSVPGSNWVAQFSAEDLTHKLYAASLLPAGAGVTGLDLDPADILPSGRPSNVLAHLSTGITVRIDARAFRFALGLKSTWVRFKSAKAGALVEIDGRGWGHGVGMSQWGARLMANPLGKKFGEILDFYYSGVELRPATGSDDSSTDAADAIARSFVGPQLPVSYDLFPTSPGLEQLLEGYAGYGTPLGGRDVLWSSRGGLPADSAAVQFTR